MDIKFGMPEILVIFALVIYSQSFTFAVTSFVLGLLGRIFVYIINFHEKQTQAESIKEGVDEVAEALKGIFNTDA